MAVHESYVCRCQNPVPRHIHVNEESGICDSCGGLYDEPLYEMRCRQYEPDWHYESVDAWLREKDPNYLRIVTASQ